MLLVSMGTQPIQCERIINSILDANIKDEIIIQAYYKNESNRIIQKNVLLLLINFLYFFVKQVS